MSGGTPLTLGIVLNGRRLERTVPADLTLREFKAQLVASDGFGEVDGVEHLLGQFLFRGKKLEDDMTLEAAGVLNRDKLMVGYVPLIKDLLAQLAAIRAETASLQALREGGQEVHSELFTRQLLKLDALDLSDLTGEAKDVMRAMRKIDLTHLLELEAGHAGGDREPL